MKNICSRPLSLALLSFFLFACSDEKPSTPVADAGTDTAEDAAVSVACPVPMGAGTVHDTFLIKADEVWTLAGSPHYVPAAGLAIRGATVTVQACAVVVMASNATIAVGDSASAPSVLRATGEVVGGVLRPVTFTSSAADVFFDGLNVAATGTLDLSNTIVERGGSVTTGQANGAIVASGGNDLPTLQNVRLVNVLIRNSAGFGVHMRSFSAFSADSSGLTIVGAGQSMPIGNVPTTYPVFLTTTSLSSLPSGIYVGNKTDGIFVNGGNRFASSVSLKNVGVPYFFQNSFHLEPNDTNEITLAIEAGVTLAFLNTAGKARVSLGTSSGVAYPASLRPVKVVAQGTAAKPIRFTSAAAIPAAGDWVGISWGGGPAAGNVLDYVTVDYAGAPSQTNSFGCGPKNNDAALIISSWQPAASFITNSTFRNSAGGGIVSGWDSPTSGPNLKANNSFTALASACAVSQPKVASVCPGNDAIDDCF